MLSVSVIIPAYNAADTIRSALDSVAAQSGWDKEQGAGGIECEIIVVDDCSTDDTASIAREFLQVSGFRFQVSSFSSNSGPAAARNRGIAESRGAWIAFLDADDEWLPDKIDIQLKLAQEHPDVVMWCGRVRGKDEGGNLKPERGKEGEGKAESPSSFSFHPSSFNKIVLDDLIVGNPVATSTVLAKKAALQAAGGFDERFRGPEDYDLWMRMAACGTIGSIEYPLSRYGDRTGSLSMDETKFLPQVLGVLDKAFGNGGVFADRRHLRSSAVSNQYWNASWMAFRRGARATAVNYWWKAWVLNMGSSRKVQRKWFALLWRYAFGKRMKDET
jgi:glycosyltransferase involved in cell wall biosynthesis